MAKSAKFRDVGQRVAGDRDRINALILSMIRSGPAIRGFGVNHGSLWMALAGVKPNTVTY
jgi:hypothetical protein